MSELISNQKPLIPRRGLTARPPAGGSRERRRRIQRPQTPAELARFVRRHFGLTVPHPAVCPNHNSPLDYLAASFFDQSDLLVWANRGGGKTQMAAVATVLDALFRAPISIRVLGGSFEQSDRLADYIRAILSRNRRLVVGKMTRRRVELVGGSNIQMLAQSERAVRGQHVQRIRCDEVDLFDPDVWRAVQFATTSTRSARGSIEVLSTVHRPGGLMQRLVEEATKSDGRAGAGYRLVRWCLWDVIERCTPARDCRQCPLAEDCRGLARRANGFLRIDDAIAIRARSSREAWEAEMLCKGASRQFAVFAGFDRSRHVRPLTWQGDWPTYRAIDFGYRNPFVCLWIQVTPSGCVHVIDEYVQAMRPLAYHAGEIRRRDPGPAAATYVDPAGRQRESTSGAACTELLAAAGIPCLWKGSTIVEGIELIRAAMNPPDGAEGLVVDPRCTTLIKAMESYHYGRPGSNDKPAKDGPDHPIDALRYFFINRMRPLQPARHGAY